MHQNQWLAAIKELEVEGLEMTPCPSNFLQELEFREVSYQFLNFSEGEESRQGRWAEVGGRQGADRVPLSATGYGRGARAWPGRPAPSGHTEEAA
jgi:Mn-containing catalase